MMKNYFLTLTFLLSLLSACTTTSSSGQSTTSSLVEEANELVIDTTFTNITAATTVNLIFELNENEDFTGDPNMRFTIKLNLTGESTTANTAYSFVSLRQGTFYLRVYLDTDEDQSLDEGEANTTYQVDSSNQSITIEENNRQAIQISLDLS